MGCQQSCCSADQSQLSISRTDLTNVASCNGNISVCGLILLWVDAIRVALSRCCYPQAQRAVGQARNVLLAKLSAQQRRAE